MGHGPVQRHSQDSQNSEQEKRCCWLSEQLGVGPALQQQVNLRLQVVHLTSPAHGLISPPPCVSYLLLCAPAESHVLLLNKFNIVPWHCLVVTSDYQSQLDDLNAVDLGATWRVLQVRGGGSLPACTLCMPWARRR